MHTKELKWTTAEQYNHGIITDVVSYRSHTRLHKFFRQLLHTGRNIANESLSHNLHSAQLYTIL